MKTGLLYLWSLYWLAEMFSRSRLEIYPPSKCSFAWRKLWLLIHHFISGQHSLFISPENIVSWWFGGHKKGVLAWTRLTKFLQIVLITFLYSEKTIQSNYLCFVNMFYNTINLWLKIRLPYFWAKCYDIGIMNLSFFSAGKSMFKDKKRSSVVLVSSLLTLNIFHTLF